MTDQPTINLQDPKELARARLAAVNLPQVPLEAIETYLTRFVLANRPLDYANRVLTTLMKKTMTDVDDEINAVAEAVAVRFEKLADEFGQDTGTNADPTQALKPVFMKRFEDEIKEHDSLIAQANQAINWVTSTASILQVVYFMPGQKKEEAVKPQNNLFRKLAGTFVNIDEKQESIEGETDIDTGTWMKQAKLPLAKEDFDLLKIVQEVVELYPNDVTAAKAELNSYGYDDTALTGLFTRCMAIASDQISDSTRIKEAVTNRNRTWVAELDGLDAILQDLITVNSYFHSGE